MSEGKDASFKLLSNGAVLGPDGDMVVRLVYASRNLRTFLVRCMQHREEIERMLDAPTSGRG